MKMADKMIIEYLKTIQETEQKINENIEYLIKVGITPEIYKQMWDIKESEEQE
jgi:hypothetical protein